MSVGLTLAKPADIPGADPAASLDRVVAVARAHATRGRS